MPQDRTPQSCYPIIDAYCSPGPYAKRPPDEAYSMAHLLKEHQRYGIKQRFCLFAEARDAGVEVGNRHMTHLAEQNGGTGIIWVALPPQRFYAETPEALMERAQAAGVAMFAMFPVTQGHHLAPWANGAIYAAMQQARLPLALDASQLEYPMVYEIARAYPELPIILWNVKYRQERLIIPILDACRNVHIGLGRNFIPNDGVEQFSARYGPGRLIFGSTWPIQSPGPLISYVMYSDVEPDIKRAILSENLRRLLGNVAWKVRALEVTTP